MCCSGSSASPRPAGRSSSGPWSGEVGFELLYWVPFVHWFRQKYDVDPRRLIVLSRGGVNSWYSHISARYVETFSYVSTDAFREATEIVKKQRALTPFDVKLLRRVVRGGRPRARAPAASGGDVQDLLGVLEAGRVRPAHRRATRPTRDSAAATRPTCRPGCLATTWRYASTSACAFPDTAENRRFVSERGRGAGRHNRRRAAEHAVRGRRSRRLHGRRNPPRVHTARTRCRPSATWPSRPPSSGARARSSAPTAATRTWRRSTACRRSRFIRRARSSPHHLDLAQRVFADLGTASLVPLDVRDVGLLRSTLQRAGTAPTAAGLSHADYVATIERLSVRKVCIFIGSRANYSSIKSVMRAVRAHPGPDSCSSIVGASALLDRFGSVVDVIEADGFTPDARVTMIVEGETPATMAKSTGLGPARAADDVRAAEARRRRQRRRPLRDDGHGDRRGLHEHPARAHDGRRDQRHDRREHPPRRDQAGAPALSGQRRPPAERIIRMGEPPDTVHVVGCPRIDLVARDRRRRATACRTPSGWTARASARTSTSTKPFLLVNQHPVTTEYGQGKEQIWETLMALDELQMPTIMLWPNVDAGSEDIATGMRTFREKLQARVHPLLQELPDRDLRAADAAVRVHGRQLERADSRGRVPRRAGGQHRHAAGGARPRRQRASTSATTGARSSTAIRRQLAHGRYPSDPLYGDGAAGPRIADVLARVAAVACRSGSCSRSRSDA